MRGDEIQRQVDAVRAQRSELENHIIDEYRSGYIGRREFIRRGTVVGMSLPLVAFLVAACGSGEKDVELRRRRRRGERGQGRAPGGTIKFGLGPLGSALDPIKVDNQGGSAMLGQSGEYLICSEWPSSRPMPRLAESWEPNADGSRVDVQDPRRA